MSLTVLSVAYPFAPVGPHGVGGAEQILSELDHALAAAGHASLAVACEGSQTAGRLYSFSAPAEGVMGEAVQSSSLHSVQAAIDRALATNAVDLIHMHGLDFHRYLLPSDIPVLVTLHLPISWYPKDIWPRFSGAVQFCCVSQSQRCTCPPELSSAAVIENGVPLPSFVSDVDREDFALVLGRICPEKNQHVALEAATKAGIRVLLGGAVFPYPAHRDYFEQKVRPLLDGEPVRHQFLGPLNPEQKRDLLTRAKCLLHPTLAPETSSLVAMEALALGTPVIAFRSGALPEIIEDGVTGFLVHHPTKMAEAIRAVHTLSPRTCREAAEQRFDRTRMIREYFTLYESLVRQRSREGACA